MKLYFLLEDLLFFISLFCMLGRKIYLHFIEPLPPVFTLPSFPAQQEQETGKSPITYLYLHHK